MEPLFFEPVLKRIRWGGRRLGTVLGKPLGPEADYAESWEVVDHGEDQSLVSRGFYAGHTLSELMATDAPQLVGPDYVHLKQFPLLIKFLDATDTLSVQVHPDDARAKRYDPSENGKSEAWVVIDALPDSRLYAGWKPGVTREDVRQAILQKSLPALLHSFPVQSGDCVSIPAGTVHAIGAGILLAEIQQSSDLTFRLFDWDRLGTDGHPRPLHIEDALDCCDFSAGPVSPVTPKPAGDVRSAGPRPVADESVVQAEHLISGCHFAIDRHTLPARTGLSTRPQGSCRIWLVLKGDVTMACDHHRHALHQGATCLIPAACSPVHFQSDDGCTLLEVRLPSP